MKELAQLPQLGTCARVFLETIEKPAGVYLCWQEPSRLGCVKIDTAIGSPHYLKFTGVCEVKALSRYLFAASNNSIVFWAPENPQSPPSAFIELSKDARIVSFAFHKGRFLLLWTIDFLRKVFVTLTNKKAQVLAQREVSTLGVYVLDFLELTEPPFHIETGPNRAWVTLSDGSFWTAALEDDSLADFVKIKDLHSPAVWMLQRADSVHIISCLGRRYKFTSSGNIHEEKCVAPVVRVLHSGSFALISTSTESFILKIDESEAFDENPSKWHGVLSIANRAGNLDEIVCVFRSGRICWCPVDEFFSNSSREDEISNKDPWAKLSKMADLRESLALTRLPAIDSVQRQMALLMYLKFNAVRIDCKVTLRFFPSLVEDQIVSCDLKAKEAFDPSMWVVTSILKPHGRDVAMSKSAPFHNEGTSISLQFEYPRSILLNLRIYLSLKSCLLPRTLSLVVHEQDVCSLSSGSESPNPGFLVHRPSMESCVGEDLQSFLLTVACGDKNICSVTEVGNTQLARIVLHGAHKRQILSLRAVFLKYLQRATFSTEPKFLVPKFMEQCVKKSKDQLHTCTSMDALMTFYEQWRGFTMKLPIL